MTASEVTVGSFTNGIWSIRRLDPGQTASITYAATGPGAAAPSDPMATEREELPFTGPRERLATLAIVGIGLIGFGFSLLRSARVRRPRTPLRLARVRRRAVGWGTGNGAVRGE